MQGWKMHLQLLLPLVDGLHTRIDDVVIHNAEEAVEPERLCFMLYHARSCDVAGYSFHPAAELHWSMHSTTCRPVGDHAAARVRFMLQHDVRVYATTAVESPKRDRYALRMI